MQKRKFYLQKPRPRVPVRLHATTTVSSRRTYTLNAIIDAGDDVSAAVMHHMLKKVRHTSMWVGAVVTAEFADGRRWTGMFGVTGLGGGYAFHNIRTFNKPELKA